MEVVHGIGALRPGPESSVTVGFFDGVHRGHQAVIRRAVDVGRERRLRPVAVTFDRHPLATLSPGKVPPLLSTLRRKASLIEALGVETLLVLEFTEEVASWPPDAFVDRVLSGGLRAGHAVVGANFTFGHKAAGNVEVLTDLGRARGFSVEGMALLKVDARPVSSTSVREALAEGDLVWPERALGRRHAVEGTVVEGAGRGRDLGWPTANLRTPEGLLLPAGGVYAGRARLGESAWPAAINIGTNPTFGGDPYHLEAHLVGFEGSLRGRVLEVEFWARLRDEVRFDGPDALARQIGEDVERTRELVREPAG
jgi:riboflavin kinase/FMN adenylyltransferase